ncbi:hypothetical protein ACFSQ7_25575 [Paenibacillus rhizoplanae]
MNYYNTHLLTTVDNMRISNEEFYSGEQAYPVQLMIKDWSEDGTLLFTLDYQTQIIGKDEAETLVDCLLHVLNQMVHTPDLPLKELTLTTERQCKQTLIHYNQPSIHNYSLEKDGYGSIRRAGSAPSQPDCPELCRGAADLCRIGAAG